MPAVSKKQQRFMGMVHALNKGEIKPSDVSKDVQDVAKDMKKKDAKDFASTKHKGLPMKKEILNKLKEMIRQELSEYTYGVGDIVKDVNPTCLHYGAIGKVKEVNPKYVKFVVMNNGDRFKKGQTLEKSHDQMKKMSESINESKKEKDQIIKYLQGLGFDERTAKNGVAKSYDYISKAYRNTGTRYKGDLIANILNKKESVNEFSMKLQKSTQDMVDALLKVKSPMPKEIESALIMMAKGYGLDYVKKEVQRDAKGFYRNLKQMAAAFPEFKNKPKDYKFESIIQERNDEVQTGKDYTKLWLQGIGLIMKQANGLRGALAKHPVKRDLNKLKAVETLFKKFIKPAVEREGKDNRHYAPNQTELKKYLSNSKFRIPVRILRKTVESSNGYDENSWYYLGDKEKQLIKKISRVLLDIENKMEKANLENVNESMSPSQLKKMRDDFEKTGELPPHLKKFVKDVNVLKKKHKVKNIVVPGLEWMSDMKESVNEFRNKREADTAIDQIGNKALYMIGAKDFVFGKSDGKNSLVFKIMRNSKGVSHIRMRLTSLDLYDMEFAQVRMGNKKVKAVEKRVYGDQLQKFFKKHTGMNTYL